MFCSETRCRFAEIFQMNFGQKRNVVTNRVQTSPGIV